MRRPHSPRAHSMQAAAAARRARRHPHRRSAAPRQRWPRVRAARRTKEHELQVDGLHRSPRSGRTGSASATWWLLRRQCRATRSAGWRGRRPTTGELRAQLLAAPPRRKMHAPWRSASARVQGARKTCYGRQRAAATRAPQSDLCQRRRQSSHQDAVRGEGDGEGGPVRCPPAAPRLRTPPSRHDSSAEGQAPLTRAAQRARTG